MPLFSFLAAAALKFTLTYSLPAPHQMQIKAQVPSGTSALAVTLLSESYSRQSVFEVDSRRSVYWVEWRGVPGGVYQLRGEARLDGGKIIQSAPINVRVCCGDE